MAGIWCVVAILVGLAVYQSLKKSTVPATTSATTTPIENTAPTVETATTSATVAAVKPIPVRLLDTVASWNFTNSYTGNAELEKKANTEINRLTGLIGTNQYSDYSLFVSIANQYDLLGDGNNEFVYLKKALAINSNSGGLAWNNLGQLMERLGAFKTAKMAYANAVAAQPNVGSYQEAELKLLTIHFPQDTSAIETAFNNGMKESLDSNLLPIKAEWLDSIGSTTGAIAAWKEFATYVPANQQGAINAKIAQLQAKQ